MDNEFHMKFTQLRNILDKAYEKNSKKKKDGSGYTVGMVTSMEQEDVAWIYRELRRVGDHVIDVKYINVTDIKGKDLETALSECTFYIYISTEERWKHASTAEQRKYTLTKLGKKKVLIVLLTEMEDSSDEAKKKIIKKQSGMEKYAAAVFLFGKMEKRPEYPANGNNGASWRTTNPPPEEYSGPKTLNAGNPDEDSRSPSHQPQDTQLPDSKEHPRPKTMNIENPYQHSPPPYRQPPYTHFPDTKAFQADVSQQEQVKRKHIVGIFTRSGERDFSWLVTMLRENFQDYIGDVRCCYTSSNTQQQFLEDMSQCTFGIVYHSKNRGRVNVTDVAESLYDKELEALSAKLGQKNVLVLIDDLEEGNDLEKARILQAQPSIDRWACDLVLISGEEKANNAELVTKLKNLKFIFGGEEEEPQSPNTRKASPVQTMERIPQTLPTPSRSTVAIFSGSEEKDYSWLSLQLSAESVDVRHYKIPARNNPEEKAFKCKLVILYHSRKHGKLHLTDVKDALYHEDLETLSAKFGKRKVIMVIDDLEDSGDKVKGVILERQPSLGRFTGEIFLFSKEEKKQLGKKSQNKHGKKIMEKINKIKEILKK